MNSDVLYVDKNRTAPLLRTIGLHWPIELQQSGYIGSISYQGQNVNIEGVSFKVDDPPEWQAYDARQEELEETYGDIKVWDFNHLLYEQERNARNLGRTATELYFDTAGEIEARDTAGRRNLTEEQRKKTPPVLGGEDTVFAEGNNPSNEYIPGVVSEKEIADNINAIAEMKSVVSIKGNEFKMGDHRLLTDVTEFFNSVGGTVYNDRLGDVFLRKRGVRHDLGHGMSDEKAASFAAIPAVLEYGKVAGFVINYEGRGYDSATVIAPITIGDEPYMMGVIVHRSNKENRFYVHDVVAIKEEAAPLITGTHKVGETGGATSTISIIRKILDVKKNNVENVDGNRQFSISSVAAGEQATHQAEEQTGQDPSQAEVRVKLPAKARGILEKAERDLENTLGNDLYVPRFARRERLRPIVQEISNAYLENGTLDQEKLDFLFDKAFAEGIIADAEFYDQYKDMKKKLRTTAVTLDAWLLF